MVTVSPDSAKLLPRWLDLITNGWARVPLGRMLQDSSHCTRSDPLGGNSRQTISLNKSCSDTPGVSFSQPGHWK